MKDLLTISDDGSQYLTEVWPEFLAGHPDADSFLIFFFRKKDKITRGSGPIWIDNDGGETYIDQNGHAFDIAPEGDIVTKKTFGEKEHARLLPE